MLDIPGSAEADQQSEPQLSHFKMGIITEFILQVIVKLMEKWLTEIIQCQLMFLGQSPILWKLKMRPRPDSIKDLSKATYLVYIILAVAT